MKALSCGGTWMWVFLNLILHTFRLHWNYYSPAAVSILVFSIHRYYTFRTIPRNRWPDIIITDNNSNLDLTSALNLFFKKSWTISSWKICFAHGHSLECVTSRYAIFHRMALGAAAVVMNTTVMRRYLPVARISDCGAPVTVIKIWILLFVNRFGQC